MPIGSKAHEPEFHDALGESRHIAGAAVTQHTPPFGLPWASALDTRGGRACLPPAPSIMLSMLLHVDAMEALRRWPEGVGAGSSWDGTGDTSPRDRPATPVMITASPPPTRALRA